MFPGHSQQAEKLQFGSTNLHPLKPPGELHLESCAQPYALCPGGAGRSLPQGPYLKKGKKKEYMGMAELADALDLGAVTLVKGCCSVSDARDPKN